MPSSRFNRRCRSGKKELIRELIERANQFGLDDMLDELKREGERVGAYLKVEEKL